MLSECTELVLNFLHKPWFGHYNNYSLISELFFGKLCTWVSIDSSCLNKKWKPCNTNRLSLEHVCSVGSDHFDPLSVLKREKFYRIKIGRTVWCGFWQRIFLSSGIHILSNVIQKAGHKWPNDKVAPCDLAVVSLLKQECHGHPSSNFSILLGIIKQVSRHDLSLPVKNYGLNLEFSLLGCWHSRCLFVCLFFSHLFVWFCFVLFFCMPNLTMKDLRELQKYTPK